MYQYMFCALLTLSCYNMADGYIMVDAMTNACNVAKRITSNVNPLSGFWDQFRMSKESSGHAMIDVGKHIGALVEHPSAWSWQSVQTSLEIIYRDAPNAISSLVIASLIEGVCFKHQVEIGLMNMRRGQLSYQLNEIEKGWNQHRGMFREFERRLVEGDFRFSFSDYLFLSKVQFFMSDVVVLLQRIKQEIPAAEQVYKDHKSHASDSFAVGTAVGVLGAVLGNPLPFVFQAAYYIAGAYEYQMAGQTQQYIHDLKIIQDEATLLYSEMYYVRVVLVFMLVVSTILNIIWYTILLILLICIVSYIRRRNIIM